MSRYKKVHLANKMTNGLQKDDVNQGYNAIKIQAMRRVLEEGWTPDEVVAAMPRAHRREYKRLCKTN
jgi:hypothetical protein